MKLDRLGAATRPPAAVGADPCAFSPSLRHAEKLANFYVGRFPPGGKVLDLGFGQGTFLRAAEAAGLEAIGLDADQELVEAAQGAGRRAIAGDVRHLKEAVGDTMFDGVIASHLIEHLPPADVRQLLQSIASVIKPGGILLLATPNIADRRVSAELFWWDPTHVRPYPAQAVMRLAHPADWIWDSQGFEPSVLNRDTVGVWIRKLLYGWSYGRTGCWYQLRRV